jgi:hypothetical protein
MFMDSQDKTNEANCLLYGILSDTAKKTELLLNMAREGPSGMETVVRAAMHVDILGDEAKTVPIRNLFLRLEELENEHPRLRDRRDIVNKLISVLTLGEGHGLPQKRITMIEWRSHAASCIIFEIGEKRGVKVAGHLLFAIKNPYYADIASQLLGNMEGKPLGKADAESMRIFIHAGIQRLHDPAEQRSARIFLKKLIEEGQNPLICLAAPLLTAMEDACCSDIARQLLDLMDEKKLGRGDNHCMNALATVAAEALSDPKRKDHAVGFIENVMGEAKNDPIYFVGPLLEATLDDKRTVIAQELLELMEGLRLGKGDEATFKATMHLLSRAAVNAVQKPLARRIIQELVDEGIKMGPIRDYESPKWKPRHSRHQDHQAARRNRY